MGKHSKNNTARSNFTATEYQYAAAKWGSKKGRLGGDSMRNFDQCSLCLSTAIEPMACTEGHLFCKECIYSNLLDQKAEIKAHHADLLRLLEQQEEEKAKAREQARERVLKDFERIGGFGSSSAIAGPSLTSSTSNQVVVSVGTKRKAEDQLTGLPSLASLPARAQQVAQQAEDEALAAIEAEHRAKRRSKLPSFWLPSLTPSEKEGIVDLKSLTKSMAPRCRVEKDYGHPISLKSLVAVKFSQAPSEAATNASNSGEASTAAEADSSRPKICPSCKKALSNSHRLYVVRRCAHTFCNHCAEQLILGPATGDQQKDKKEKPTKTVLACCPQCDQGTIQDLSKDVVKLHREGTGYASAGGVEAKKSGIVFQG